MRGPEQLNGAVGIDRGYPETFERHRDAAHVAHILAESERFALILDRALAVPEFPPHVREAVKRVDESLLEAHESQIEQGMLVEVCSTLQIPTCCRHVSQVGKLETCRTWKICALVALFRFATAWLATNEREEDLYSGLARPIVTQSPGATPSRS